MKFLVKPTSQFKKDYKLIIKRHLNKDLLQEVVALLADGKSLPEKYHDHALIGNYANHRECHITNDWLLIYQICNDVLVLELTRTGSHSDLFNK
jgi:mRNA interferase YafQ